MTSPYLPTIITPFELSKIRWKSQVYTHLLFGIWMAMLAALSWNVGFDAVIKVAVIYLSLYLLVYIPLFALLPYLTLKPILPTLSRFGTSNTPTESETEKVIVFLLNLPKRALIENIVVTMSAFTFGSMMGVFNVVPELRDVMHVAVFQTIILGIIITIIETLYNYTFVQEKVYESVGYLVSLHPNLARKQFQSNHMSLQTKLLLSLIGLSVSGQISILLFFATYLTTAVPDQKTLVAAVLFMALVMLFSVVNLVLLAPKIANTFTKPLKTLKDWSISISQGNLESLLTMRTTDEMADVIVHSNNMVYELSNERTRLEGEHSKLEAVVEGIVDSVIALDQHNKITFVNKQTLTLFGLSETSLVGSDPGTHISIFDSSNTDITYRIFTKTDTPMSRAELRLVDANAHSKFVNIVNTPISSNSNETSYVIAIHDITHEKEFEQMKIDFVAIAAHELRTPLTAATGYLATLQEEMAGFSDDHKLFVNRAFESTQQLTDLVDDLLAISRIERGVLKLEKKPTDWDELLNEAVTNSSNLAKDKNIKLTVIMPTIPLPKINADKARIMEVLHNLISNAIKYSPSKTRITIHTDREENNVITHVTDQGIGIPKSAIPKLFSKFYRVSESSDDAHGGTGLGLYISKAIIEMHDGKIWLDSNEGKGSTFSFSLPIKNRKQT